MNFIGQPFSLALDFERLHRDVGGGFGFSTPLEVPNDDFSESGRRFF